MTPQAILKTACRFYGLSPEDIAGTDISRRIAWPRFAAMSLCRKYSRVSLPRIGRAFHRHHSTVLHAIARTDVLCRKRPDFALLLARLEKILEADMQIYISGPRSGTADQTAFAAAAEKISAHPGYVALNPLELSLPAEWTYDMTATTKDKARDAMRTCFGNLVGCNAIVMLNGWQKSHICKLEHDVAQTCGLMIYTSLPVLLMGNPMQGAAE